MSLRSVQEFLTGLLESLFVQQGLDDVSNVSTSCTLLETGITSIPQPTILEVTHSYVQVNVVWCEYLVR